MRLLDVNTLSLKDCSSKKKPKYTILSHRWTKDELTIADVCSKKMRQSSSRTKLQGFLRQTKLDGLNFAWTDTCCIDKQSSAEFSEAINSMYRWYQEAERCYVYLQDVDKDKDCELLHKSEWFRRGWTLQELLAPSNVIFYDCKWRPLGDKTTLANELSRITGIDPRALIMGDLHQFSVAQKMSWAAKRITTRKEDGAYCLMGLFDVNMPLLYGEGERAFLRLQEEIIKHSDDHSIFAWSMGKTKFSGLLAPSPSRFAGCQQVVSEPPVQGREPFSMTNRGLSIKLEVTPWSADTYLAYLDCAKKADSDENQARIGIFLRRLKEDDQYARMNYSAKGLRIGVDKDQYWRTRPTRDRHIFVRQLSDWGLHNDCLRRHAYGFKVVSNCIPSMTILRAFQISPDGRTATLRSGSWGCVMTLTVSTLGLCKIALGFDFDFNPVCILEDSSLDNENGDVWDWSRVFADTVEWDEISEDHRVYRKKTHDGRWALKGHRLSGLDVLLSAQFNDRGSLVTMKRGETKSGSIWQFDIDELIGPFRSLQPEALREGFGSRRKFQESYGLGMTGEGLEEGDELLKVLFPSMSYVDS